MSIDLQKALKAPMQIDGWLLKVFIGGLVYLVPILCFAAFGYWLQCLLSELNGKPQLPGGPTDNLSKNFVTGLKLFVGYVIIGIAAGLAVGLISVILSKMQIVAALITLVLEIAAMFAAIFLTLSFAMDRKILSMLDVQRTMQIMKGHPDTVNFIVQMILLSLIYFAVIILCCITVVGIVLAPFISYMWGISMYNLMGQYLKGSPYIAQMIAKRQQQNQQPQQ